jgi:hypothetical protein
MNFSDDDLSPTDNRRLIANNVSGFIDQLNSATRQLQHGPNRDERRLGTLGSARVGVGVQDTVYDKTSFKALMEGAKK